MKILTFPLIFAKEDEKFTWSKLEVIFVARDNRCKTTSKYLNLIVEEIVENKIKVRIWTRKVRSKTMDSRNKNDTVNELKKEDEDLVKKAQFSRKS